MASWGREEQQQEPGRQLPGLARPFLPQARTRMGQQLPRWKTWKEVTAWRIRTPALPPRACVSLAPSRSLATGGGATSTHIVRITLATRSMACVTLSPPFEAPDGRFSLASSDRSPPQTCATQTGVKMHGGSHEMMEDILLNEMLARPPHTPRFPVLKCNSLQLCS